MLEGCISSFLTVILLCQVEHRGSSSESYLVPGGPCWLEPETGFLHPAAIPQLHQAEKPSITSAGDTPTIKHNIIKSLFMIFQWNSHLCLCLGYAEILNYLPVSICRADTLSICKRRLIYSLLDEFYGPHTLI